MFEKVRNTNSFEEEIVEEEEIEGEVAVDETADNQNK